MVIRRRVQIGVAKLQFLQLWRKSGRAELVQNFGSGYVKGMSLIREQLNHTQMVQHIWEIRRA